MKSFKDTFSVSLYRQVSANSCCVNQKLLHFCDLGFTGCRISEYTLSTAIENRPVGLEYVITLLRECSVNQETMSRSPTGIDRVLKDWVHVAETD